MIATDQYGKKLEVSEPVVSPEYKINNMLVGYYSNEPVDFDEWLKNPKRTMYPHKAEVVEVKDNKTFKTFCKIWTIWDENTKQHYPVRIGLGAYGDLTIWHRQVNLIR